MIAQLFLSSPVRGFTAACALLAALAGASTAVAQGTGPTTRGQHRMINATFTKLNPGVNAEFLRIERQLKPVFQEMVNKGNITSWKLYAVSFPNGEQNEYDYVSLFEYPTFAHLEAPYANVDRTKILGGEEARKKLDDALNAAVKRRHTQTLTVLDATSGFSTATHRVMSVHFLRALPGKANDFIQIQRNYNLPLNEERMQSGNTTGWASTRVRFPVNSDAPYTFISFNAYSSLQQMGAPVSAESQEKWRAKTVENNAQLNVTRVRVRNDLWRLVDQTEPVKAVAAKP